MPLISRSPVDSIRLAVLTVSPKRQYLGILTPTTPAQQGPKTQLLVSKLQDVERLSRFLAKLFKKDTSAADLTCFLLPFTYSNVKNTSYG